MICRTCGLDKPESEFNWAKKGVRRQRVCRACFSEYNRRRYASNPDKFKNAVKEYQSSNPERYLEIRLNAATKNPTKMNAHRVVEAALSAGVLVKPNTCSKCGCTNTEHRIEAHHTDYTKPLDVVWLCTPCHRRADAERRVQEGLKAYPTLKAVDMLDDDGLIIKTFSCRKEAAEYVHRPASAITYAIKSGKRCAGFLWRDAKDVASV